MDAGEVVLGAAYLAVVVAASGLVARATVRAGGGPPRGAPRGVALAIAGGAAFFVAHLIPGALGILTRESVAVTALALAAIAHAVTRGRGASVLAGAAEPAPAAESAISRGLGFAAVFAVIVYLLALAFEYGGEALRQPDVASFHLPNIARWIQDGSFWQIDDFIPNRAPGNYPQTGDVFVLGAILPFESDFLARFPPYLFLGLTGLASYCGARELGSGTGVAMLVSAALVAMPVVGFIGAQGVADPEMLGTFAAGAYFLLRWWRTEAGFDLALAGVGLGLAFGTRWYAVAAVGAVLAVWLAGNLLAGRREGLWRRVAVLGSLVAVFGGFWLLRNLVESGNPVFPVEVGIGSLTLFDAPADLYRELEGYTLLDYATDPGIWRAYFWEPFLDFMSWVSVLGWALIALAGGLAWSLRRRPGQPAGPVLAMVAAAAIIVAAYVITPYTAVGPEGAPTDAWVNGRYVVPALLVTLPAIAWALRATGRLGLWIQGLLLVATLDALRRSSEFPGGDVGAVALILAAVLGVLGALAIAWIADRRPRLGIGARAGAAAVAAAALLALLVAFEDDYAEDRYADIEPIAIVDAAGPDTRVGLLGEGWGIQGLFGDDLSNDVTYIGARVDEMLRPLMTRDALADALERSSYDYIYWQDMDSLDPTLPGRQASWLEGLGWRAVADGGNPSFGPAIRTTLYSPDQAEASR